MSNKKVFFITSNQSKLDKEINYTLAGSGAINLKPILTKTQKYKMEDFTINVLTFEFVVKDLKDIDKDQKTKKYKAKVNLNFKKYSFPGQVEFLKERNNFIYDFKFKEHNGWTGNISPPLSIKFCKTDQIHIFNEVLRKLNVKQEDELSLNLISDSQLCIKGNNFDLNFYIEIYKLCYKISAGNLHLAMFKLERVLLPQKFETKLYSGLLNLIEKKLTKDSKTSDKFLNPFFTLLLYFRDNYQKDKVQPFLARKELWKNFVEILPKNYKYFPNIVIPDELINEMLKKKSITFLQIKGILSFAKSIDKILFIINNNLDLIAECCKKEGQKINISEMVNPNQNDDLNKVIEEIKKIIQYQIDKKEKFILFDEEFWKNYLHFNEKTNLTNLLLINKAILLYKGIDKSLNYDKLGIKFKIHNTGLQMIEKGEIKNEEFLNFIENEDIYFQDKNYEGKGFRPISVLKAIDLEKADEKFFDRWEKSNIFKIFSFNDYEFKKTLIDKVNDMKDFGKLLKLFNYKDDKKFDHYTVSLLRENFKNIIKTYKIESCPNFIKDVSLFIYVNDQKHQEMNKFIKNTIERNIKSVQTLTDIYINLASNYKDVSKNVVDCITDYFTKNKDKLNGEKILFLFQQLDSKDIVKSLLNKIDNYVIKEEEILKQEAEIDSFKLLQGIIKGKLLEKYPELTETNYLKNTISISQEFLNKIKIGEINYNSLYSMWSTTEKKKNI